jgi:hypothetical protein
LQQARIAASRRDWQRVQGSAARPPPSSRASSRRKDLHGGRVIYGTSAVALIPLAGSADATAEGCTEPACGRRCAHPSGGPPTPPADLYTTQPGCPGAPSSTASRGKRPGGGRECRTSCRRRGRGAPTSCSSSRRRCCPVRRRPKGKAGAARRATAPQRARRRVSAEQHRAGGASV